MYILMLQAIATAENDAFPVGERHAILAFANQMDHTSAKVAVLSSLAEHGWSEAVFIRTKQASNEAIPEDRMLRSAFLDALNDGCSLVTYRDPIDDATA